MDNGSESPRGVHALRVLSVRKPFTPQGVIDAAFDTWLPSFDVLVPSLIAAYGARPANGTKKYYATSGNSLLAVVEFGDSVRARAVSAGGESGHPTSKHFNDQADRYAAGNLRDVYFYRSQLAGHTERQYHPGQ